MNTLSILNGKGDTKLTWNPADPAECANARRTVADLQASGYIFFLVDATPDSLIEAGAGQLVVRRLTADEVVESEPPSALVTEIAETVDPVKLAEGTDASQCQKCGKTKHRGRCRTADLHANGGGRQAIAVRPVAGG